MHPLCVERLPTASYAPCVSFGNADLCALCREAFSEPDVPKSKCVGLLFRAPWASARVCVATAIRSKRKFSRILVRRVLRRR